MISILFCRPIILRPILVNLALNGDTKSGFLSNANWLKQHKQKQINNSNNNFDFHCELKLI